MDSVTPDGPRRAPIRWHVATVRDARAESPTARTLVLDVPGWPGHVAGQHVDVRLTAEDGYPRLASAFARFDELTATSVATASMEFGRAALSGPQPSRP